MAMRPITVTSWFDPDVRPVRVGVYERIAPELGGWRCYSLWTGAFWGISADTPNEAAMCPHQSNQQGWPWRGLDFDPMEGAE